VKPRGHSAAGVARAATKVESASTQLRRKADELDALAEQLDLWLRPQPGSRQPRFTRDDIAHAALHIADGEGFEALSMRRLAAELDAGTMTLYHYVRTKDELLTLVSDTVMEEVLVPDGELPGDWRAAITMIAHRTRDALRRHPWALDIRDDPAPGPNGVRHFDQSMRALEGAGLGLGDRFELATAVDEYVFGFCLTERANLGSGDQIDEPTLAYVTGLIATGGYPALSAIAAEHGVTGAFEILRDQLLDPERFSRNLSRLLDGFEAGMEPT
jgi:AcrR family transcriptional regulator